MRDVSAFKAYDIRGKVGVNLDEALAYDIGRAFARVMTPGRVVLGRDVRDSSPMLQQALALGLEDGGAQAVDIGLCGTEEVYFATFHGGFDGGIMVTASHNPLGYNGMKLVRAGSAVTPACANSNSRSPPATKPCRRAHPR